MQANQHIPNKFSFLRSHRRVQTPRKFWSQALILSTFHLRLYLRSFLLCRRGADPPY